MNQEEPAFKIKNSNFHLFVLHLLSTDIEQLKIELEAKLVQTPGFFTNAPMVIGLAAIAETGIIPDFADLTLFMRHLGMRTAGVLGGSPEQREAAVQAGLGLLHEVPSRPVLPAATAPETHAKTEVQVQPELPGFEKVAEAQAHEHEVEIVQHPPSNDVQIAQAANIATSPAFRPSMVIDKPVRTGQRIYAEGSDLVVLAIVNAGAELIADGNIHIYAPLRGRAIAGAHGNKEARIFAHRLEAELISIAGCFQVFEDGIPEHLRGKPVQVHLDGTSLVFQLLPA